MTRAEKAEKIRKHLDAAYPSPPIPLDHRDPFTLLISVLLSAQCTDVRVNQVTPALFALAAAAGEMTKLSPARIRSIIRSCGLSQQKSKAIYGLSKILVEQHEGRVPENFDQL